MNIAPTGKPMTIAGISILRVANGKIAEQWVNWDTLGMMQQISAVPALGQATGKAASEKR